MVKKRGKVSKPKGVKLSDYKRKTKLILRNLVIFVILFVLTLWLSSVFSGEFLTNLFWISALIAGFVSVALVISYFIFLFFKLFGK